MTKIFFVAFSLLLHSLLFSQNSLNGSFLTEYKNEKGLVARMEIKAKDSLVYLKFTEGGLSKYDHFVLNLNSREFFTISQIDKRVIIKYDLDKLLEMYDTEKLKSGYKRDPGLAFKVVEENKEGNGTKMTRYVFEDRNMKASFLLAGTTSNFDQLIPLLRLMGSWNETQFESGTIVNAEVENKTSAGKSSVRVVIGKESVPNDIFELPKGYITKDFGKLVEEEKKNKSLLSVIQAFAGF